MLDLFKCMIPQKILKRGYTIVMDNWYTTMEVIDYFLKQSTSIVGTIRKQRVGKWFGYDQTNEQCKVT